MNVLKERGPGHGCPGHYGFILPPYLVIPRRVAPQQSPLPFHQAIPIIHQSAGL